MKEWLFSLDRESKKPLYVQIYEQIKNEIISGRLEPRSSLPSVRALTNQLGVNKITLEAAYSQLVMEGYIDSRPRSGYFVKEIDIEYFQRKSVSAPDKRAEKPKIDEYRFDFHLSHVDRESFPLATWKKLSNEVLNHEWEDVFLPGDPQGESGLRNQIAAYLSYSRGVSCTGEQVIIGSHSQVLIGLLCRIIGRKGLTVGVGEPGYSLATQEFEKLGHSIFPIRMEKDGLNQENLEKSKANLIFTSPSCLFPFGNIMSIQKRIALLDWAGSSGAYILEDDYLSEFRYEGDAVFSLQGLDRSERVIYMGTFHPNFLPSIRIAYMILPNHLLKNYYNDHYDFQQTTSRIHQKTLELFMAKGHWEQHIFRMKRVYQKKYETLASAVQAIFLNRAGLIESQSGLHAVLEVYSGEEEQILLKKAKRAGINIYPIKETYYRQENNTFQNPAFLLGFAGLSQEEIKEGISALHEAWFE